jgi:hypothetical protein
MQCEPVWPLWPQTSASVSLRKQAAHWCEVGLSFYRVKILVLGGTNRTTKVCQIKFYPQNVKRAEYIVLNHSMTSRTPVLLTRCSCLSQLLRSPFWKLVDRYDSTQALYMIVAHYTSNNKTWCDGDRAHIREGKQNKWWRRLGDKLIQLSFLISTAASKSTLIDDLLRGAFPLWRQTAYRYDTSFVQSAFCKPCNIGLPGRPRPSQFWYVCCL